MTMSRSLGTYTFVELSEGCQRFFPDLSLGPRYGSDSVRIGPAPAAEVARLLGGLGHVVRNDKCLRNTVIAGPPEKDPDLSQHVRHMGTANICEGAPENELCIANGDSLETVMHPTDLPLTSMKSERSKCPE